MDVVSSYGQFVDIPTVELAALEEQLLQAPGQLGFEDPAAVLGDKNYVIKAAVEGMATAPEDWSGHILDCNAVGAGI